MAARYLAKLGENNIIIGIAKIGGKECCDENGNIDEAKAIAYRTSIDKEGHSNWKLACRNGSIRANPPEIGGYYDNGKDIFVRRKPHPEATLNDKHQWELPPITNENTNEPEMMPEENSNSSAVETVTGYFWNEELQTWELLPH